MEPLIGRISLHLLTQMVDSKQRQLQKTISKPLEFTAPPILPNPMGEDKFNWTMYLPDKGIDDQDVGDQISAMADQYSDLVLELKAAEARLTKMINEHYSFKQISTARMRYEDKHKHKHKPKS